MITMIMQATRTAIMPASRQPNNTNAMSLQPNMGASRITPGIPRGSDNIPYSYLHLLSRISHRSHQASRTSVSYMEGLTSTGLLDLLLQQPPEIKIAILDNLEPRDLLTLRATSHALHNLVHESSGALCIGLKERISKANDMFYIHINIPNLSAFLQVSSRYRSACQVAAIIAEKIARHVSPTSIRLDKRALEAWRKKKSRSMERRLRRNLIVLELYLMFMLQNMNDNEGSLQPLDDGEYKSLHNIFLFDEQAFFRRHMPGLTETDSVDVGTTLDILKTTCEARCVPFKMKSPAYPFISVRHILIRKGLAPFAELLAEDAGLAVQETILRRQSRDMRQCRRSYTTRKSHDSCPTLHALEGYWQTQAVAFDVKRSSEAREKFVSHQDIWDKSARAFIQHKLERAPLKQSATAWIRKVCAEDDKSMKQSVVFVGDWAKPGA